MAQLPSTAVEFAGERGHPEHPLLSASDSPNSRVPCMDFSAWLQHQLNAGDETSAITYVLQIVEANPGVGFAIEGESAGKETKSLQSIRSGEIPTTSPLWAEIWIERSRAVLGTPLAGWVSLGPVEALDLRTALMVLLPLGPLDEFALQQVIDQRLPYLAAVMSPHELELADTDFVIERANEYIRKMQGPAGAPAWEFVNPLTVEDVSPPAVDRAMTRRLVRLPLGSRAHLIDLASKASLRGPASASKFAPFYETRRRGYHAATGLEVLRREHLVKVVTDPRTVRNVVAMELSKSDLQELLDGASIRYPKSATKQRLVEILDIHAAEKIDNLVDKKAGEIYELTDLGRAAADWALARANATSRMWDAWLAAYLAPLRI